MNIKLDLPESFFEEETRCEYVVTPEKKRIWAVELDLLNEFMSVCDAHNIRYYAFAGTMLGAIRHGGFIPWDDDVDVMMFREDFNRLNEIAPTEFQYPYFWQTEATDPGSLRGHAQLRNSTTTGILGNEFPYQYPFNQGIFLDIFPLDYIPEDAEERAHFLKSLEAQKKRAKSFANHSIRYRNIKKYSWFKRLRRKLKYIMLTYFWGAKRNKQYEQFENMMATHAATPTTRVGVLCLHPIKERFVWQSEWFGSQIEVRFETLKVPVPAHYDEILTAFYGDWRTPVRGTSIHGDVIFDTEKPYTEYIMKGDPTKTGI